MARKKNTPPETDVSDTKAASSKANAISGVVKDAEFDELDAAMVDTKVEGVKLGEIAIRGETRVLKAPVADLARMHWNPFHRLLMDELDQFLDDALEDVP